MENDVDDSLQFWQSILFLFLKWILSQEDSKLVDFEKIRSWKIMLWVLHSMEVVYEKLDLFIFGLLTQIEDCFYNRI